MIICRGLRLENTGPSPSLQIFEFEHKELDATKPERGNTLLDSP